MMTEYEVRVEPGGRLGIELRAFACGADLSVTICGGGRYHVGAVALGCPKPAGDRLPGGQATVSVICALGHRDDELARRAARFLATELARNVGISAGVHVDDASEADIAVLIGNCDAACKELAALILAEHPAP